MCETAHKHFACVRVRPNTHTKRGLHFLEGSFQCGLRTADVANHPRERERERENETEKGG